MKIALLMGGNSTEHDVSLMSAAEIQKALNPDRYQIIPIEIKKGDYRQWVQQLMDAEPDIAFLALHGGHGENGAVQGLLECLHIPYVGSKVIGSALCMDKAISKSILRAHHIPVAEDMLLERTADFRTYSDKIRRMGFPLVVKPNQGGSSVGVYIVQDGESLAQAVTDASALGDDLLIEQFIDGKEIACGIMETESGLEILPVLDIEVAGFYTYDAKYFSDQTRITFTNLPLFMQNMVSEIAKQSFRVLHCNGYARIDMIIREEDIYVLEVNTLPGLTSHSLFPKAAALAALNYGEMLDRLISFEAKRTYLSS